MVVAEDEREMLKKIISSRLMAPSWRDREGKMEGAFGVAANRHAI